MACKKTRVSSEKPMFKQPGSLAMRIRKDCCTRANRWSNGRWTRCSRRLNSLKAIFTQSNAKERRHHSSINGLVSGGRPSALKRTSANRVSSCNPFIKSLKLFRMKSGVAMVAFCTNSVNRKICINFIQIAYFNPAIPLLNSTKL